MPCFGRHTRFLAFALLFASLLSGCRSGRIPSESSNSSFSTRRSEVVSLISESDSRLADVKTYEAKNAKAAVLMEGKNTTLKANVSFERGGATNITGRLAFPPLSVGSVSISEDKVHVKSGILNIDKTQTLFPYLAEMVQSTFLGLIPKAYLLFGDKDFSHFDMSLTAKGQYLLSRSDNRMSVELRINAANFTLANVSVKTAQGDAAQLDVAQYKSFDGRLLPVSVLIKVTPRKGKPAEAEVSISDIRINK